MSNVESSLNFIKGDIVYIHGEFDDTVTTHVLSEFDVLIDSKKNVADPQIGIDINSNGGYANILYALLERVELAKVRGIIVKTRVSGAAYSCGSLLAASGTKGYRFISPYSMHLCHLGATSTGRVRNPRELANNVKGAEMHFNNAFSMYKKYAKIPNLKKTIHDDGLYLDAKQCVQWSLADKISH